MYLFIKIKVLTHDIQAMKPGKIYKLRYQRVPLYQSPGRIQNRGLKYFHFIFFVIFLCMEKIKYTRMDG